MITAITIENFKGIRERVRLRFKPLTLLFGPNSGGKSTVLKAIHYARELIVKARVNPHLTSSGVDLGGFAEFVHNHDTRRTITLRFDLDISDAVELGSCWDPLQSLAALGEEFDDAVVGAADAIHSAWIELSVCWDERSAQAYVATYKIGINGAEIAEVRARPATKAGAFETELLNLNPQHPFFRAGGVSLIDVALRESPMGSKWTGAYRIVPHRDALPRVDEAIRFARPVGRRLELVLTAALVSPLNYLRYELEEAVYLGPLRNVLPRGYQPLQRGSARYPSDIGLAEWNEGLAGWDQLWRVKPQQLEQLNLWLSDPRRLGTGYHIEFGAYGLVDRKTNVIREERRDVLFRPVTGSVLLHAAELGTGITQLIPVVVAALFGNALTTIEQPELHLHPAPQCALGDLLITGALGDRQIRNLALSSSMRPLLVETHSEHLILRILRRIRETTRGQPYDGIPITPEDLSVIYVSQQDGQSVPETIGVDEQGEFTRDWPDEFFESDFYERFS